MYTCKASATRSASAFCHGSLKVKKYVNKVVNKCEESGEKGEKKGEGRGEGEEPCKVGRTAICRCLPFG